MKKRLKKGTIQKYCLFGGGAIPEEEDEDEWDRVGKEMGVDGYCHFARF